MHTIRANIKFFKMGGIPPLRAPNRGDFESLGWILLASLITFGPPNNNLRDSLNEIPYTNVLM